MTLSSLPSRRGISPLIASVLLIVFTISIATLLVSWLNRYADTTTEEADIANQELLDCSKQRPIIDNVFANTTDSTISKVLVRNAGNANTTLRVVTIVGNDGSSCLVNGVDGTVLTVGNSVMFNTTNCAVTCSAFEAARVTTSCGSSSYEFSAKSLIVGC